MPGFTTIWEFHVEPGREQEFVAHYGPSGSWAALFREAPGYVETLLLEDREAKLHYITVDRWRDRDAYLDFRNRYAVQYAELDAQCEALTTSERCLDSFGE